jgi:hypothetical protein
MFAVFLHEKAFEQIIRPKRSEYYGSKGIRDDVDL